jgi:vacuolar-type H+-ATPase subunit H
VKSRDDRIDGPKPLASSAARRVEAIIEGAERAAERVIDDAEAKARAYLAEAEAEADRAVEERLASLGELTDALVAQADAIRRQSELLTQSLREAKERLETEGAADSEGLARPAAQPLPEGETPGEGDESNGDGVSGEADAPRPPHLSAVEPTEPAPAAPAPAEAPADPAAERREPGTPAGARLLATQMAVSGSSRQEIAARLRTGFEIEDADAILDAILGPES